MDSTASFYRSAKAFFTGTFLSRISGMARDISMTFAFGTSPEVAAFLLAFRFAHLCRRIFGEGALHTAFIPLFEEKRGLSNEEAYRFFLKTKGGIGAILVILILAVMGILGGVLAFAPLSSENREIVWLTFLMMPSLFFICLYGLNAAFLNCEKHFFMPGVSPVIFNVIWIVSALYLQTIDISKAMMLLSLSVIAGCACQWLITVPGIYSVFKNEKLRISWTMLKPDFLSLKVLLTPLALGIVGIAASQVNNTLDVLFARYANEEGPAYLWYAIRLQQLPLALFGISLSGALLPPLTRAVKENQVQRYTELLRFSFEKAFALMIPLTLALMALAPSGINLLYGRGQFTEHSAYETTLCLWGYGFGLLPMALVLLLAAVFYAQKNFRIPMYSSIISMILNLILNTLFVGFLNWGAASVAMATSISAWVNLFYLAAALPRETVRSVLPPLIEPLGKIIGASTIAFLSSYFMTYGVLGEFLHFSREFTTQCILFFGQLACFLIVLSVVIWVLRIKEVIKASKARG